MKNTQTTDRKRALVRIYHSVCHLNGMDENDKKALLAGYNAESSLDLSDTDLMKIIEKLQQKPNIWRRRVMAAIGAFLRAVNRTENTDIIKAIACRASSRNNFNQIPVSRLRDVYYEFSRKARTTASVQQITSEEIEKLQLCN